MKFLILTFVTSLVFAEASFEKYVLDLNKVTHIVIEDRTIEFEDDGLGAFSKVKNEVILDSIELSKISEIGLIDKRLDIQDVLAPLRADSGNGGGN